MRKPAPVDHPILDHLVERWSPVSFAPDPVSGADLARLLEAARWAPSSFNEQPWTFLIARRSDAEGFERLASCLVEGNAWAKGAPVLLLSVARLAFTRNGKPNRHAFHDVGLATACLMVQAQVLGLATHAMAGFDVERARDALAIPADHEPVAMMALGHPGDPNDQPEPLRRRDEASRERKPLAEIAFGSRWGEALRTETRPQP